MRSIGGGIVDGEVMTSHVFAKTDGRWFKEIHTPNSYPITGYIAGICWRVLMLVNHGRKQPNGFVCPLQRDIGRHPCAITQSCYRACAICLHRIPLLQIGVHIREGAFKLAPFESAVMEDIVESRTKLYGLHRVAWDTIRHHHHQLADSLSLY